MKKLAAILITVLMLVSIGGCWPWWWGPPDGGGGRGRGHHDRGGGHEQRRQETIICRQHFVCEAVEQVPSRITMPEENMTG